MSLGSRSVPAARSHHESAIDVLRARWGALPLLHFTSHPSLRDEHNTPSTPSARTRATVICLTPRRCSAVQTLRLRWRVTVRRNIWKNSQGGNRTRKADDQVITGGTTQTRVKYSNGKRWPLEGGDSRDCARRYPYTLRAPTMARSSHVPGRIDSCW